MNRNDYNHFSNFKMQVIFSNILRDMMIIMELIQLMIGVLRRSKFSACSLEMSAKYLSAVPGEEDNTVT